MWSALYPISNHSHIRQLQFATHAFSQQVLQQAVQISICQCSYTEEVGQQPRSQVLSSMRRRGGKTLAGAGHVIDRILIA